MLVGETPPADTGVGDGTGEAGTAPAGCTGVAASDMHAKSTLKGRRDPRSLIGGSLLVRIAGMLLR